MEQLRSIYEKYLAAAEKAEKNKTGWNGLLGLGSSTKDHPCHDEFYEDMEQWTGEFLKREPTQQECEAVITFIFETSEKYRNTLTYWYMYVAHGFTRGMIPKVSSQFAGRMRVWYNQRNPRPDRMPVQQEVFKLLQRQEKAK